MEKLVKNAKELYDIRRYIVSVFEGVELKELEEIEDEELKKESNFDWLFKNENGQKEL